MADVLGAAVAHAIDCFWQGQGMRCRVRMPQSEAGDERSKMPSAGRLVIAVTSLLLAQAGSAELSTDEDGVKFVREFFAAFDRRDLVALQAAFAPDALIVHDDGVQQTVPELIETIRKAKIWGPRRRTISGCTTQSYGVVVIVGCLNRVEAANASQPSTVQTYNETWVLERTTLGLRAVRSHYSLVAKVEHSEG